MLTARLQIQSRIKKLCYGLDMRHVDPLAYVNAFYFHLIDAHDTLSITIKVVQGVYHGVTTVELDVRGLRYSSLNKTDASAFCRTSPPRPPHTSPHSTPTTLFSPRVSPSPTFTRRRQRAFPRWLRSCTTMVRLIAQGCRRAS